MVFAPRLGLEFCLLFRALLKTLPPAPCPLPASLVFTGLSTGAGTCPPAGLFHMQRPVGALGAANDLTSLSALPMLPLGLSEYPGASGKADWRPSVPALQEEYRNSMPASSFQQQKLRVCEVCSAYLGLHDNDRRLADHFGGKLHLGFIQIREKLDQLRVR